MWGYYSSLQCLEMIGLFMKPISWFRNWWHSWAASTCPNYGKWRHSSLLRSSSRIDSTTKSLFTARHYYSHPEFPHFSFLLLLLFSQGDLELKPLDGRFFIHNYQECIARLLLILFTINDEIVETTNLEVIGMGHATAKWRWFSFLFYSGFPL